MKCWNSAFNAQGSKVIIIIVQVPLWVIRVIRKVILFSPCFHPLFGPAFTPYPLFQLYLWSNEIFLNFNMKCWNSAFNAQGSKVIIIIVQVPLWVIRVIRKVILSSPCFHPVFGPAFTPYPLFQLYPRSNEIFLNFNLKCWNSACNAQGSKVIIVIVQVGAPKIYVAAVEALRKKEREVET
jgi:hypothetical protein